MTTEQEIKFLLNAQAATKLRGQIRALPGVAYEGRNYERTVMYDNNKAAMAGQDARLRLRHVKNSPRSRKAQMEFSYKRRLHAKDGIKTEEEIEVHFTTQPAVFEKILNKMGYHEKSSYERWRETYMVGEAKITLDQFPFGYILEIEGHKPIIKQVTKGLQLNPQDSYGRSCDDAYEELCQRKGITPHPHITFADSTMPQLT
ncbi:class IV adenylate cyclase [Candidatus Microgenomates bacterium]|nr:class IV adenylate cyclase [Candidatus Microgenomates bacterium]